MTDSESHARDVVQVLLYVHVARAGEIGILVADGGGRNRQCAIGIFGAVNESEQIAVVEEPETVHLVDDGDRAAPSTCRMRSGQLEAHVQRLGADVEQQVAGRGRGLVPRAVQFDERMQLGRSRTAEQPVPRLASRSR